MNLWHDLNAGPDTPRTVNVVVEIPKGSRNKFELDKSLGLFRLDRVLYSAMEYPGDYGLIPQTYYDDGDPLDILVMVTEPTFTGCVIRARPIGVFRMIDRKKRDDKILAVPDDDPLARDYHDIKDIPQHYLKEVAHFFSVYKDLEGARVKGIGWEGATRAHECIMYSVGLYKKKIKKPR
jgi:inorganic pyrophosphatase